MEPSALFFRGRRKAVERAHAKVFFFRLPKSVSRNIRLLVSEKERARGSTDQCLAVANASTRRAAAVVVLVAVVVAKRARRLVKRTLRRQGCGGM